MAAFSTLAIAGLVGAIGGALANKRRRTAATPPIARGPATGTLLSQAPNAIAAESASVVAARQAAAKTRRRAMGAPGSRVTARPGVSQAGQSAYSAPRSLIGS